MTLQVWITLGSALLILIGLLATYFGPIGWLQKKYGELSGKFDLVNFESLFHRLNETETKISNFETTAIATKLFNMPERIMVIEGKLSGVDLTKMNSSLISIETKIGDVNLADLATKMTLFWVALEPVLKDWIHHPEPEHARKDRLLELFPNLTVEEMCELRDLIKAEKFQMLAKQSKDRVYILGLGLSQAMVETALVDKRGKC
jgi:hypothetical protein